MKKTFLFFIKEIESLIEVFVTIDILFILLIIKSVFDYCRILVFIVL
ncbi:hypothetical protein C8C88_2203 [Flavobacterium sp. 123]|jgi:hypothetical protein|nr:hypothetical protein C8C88_2203 [Flavobacterium sp. 123]